MSVTYKREVRLLMGNPGAPSQNSARESAAPLDWAVAVDSCPYMLRARAARGQCSSLFNREKCKIEKSTKSSMYTSPNSFPCGSGRSGITSEHSPVDGRL